MTSKPENPRSDSSDPPVLSASSAGALPIIHGLGFPAALWTSDRTRCLLNDAAAAFLDFNGTPSEEIPLAWSERIHRSDRAHYFDFCRRLRASSQLETCDYRFHDGAGNLRAWLRETAAPTAAAPASPGWRIVSIFFDISDLKQPQAEALPATVLDDIFDSLFHDAQNSVHRIAMEMELKRMGIPTPAATTNTAEIVERLEAAIRDLRSFISPLQERKAWCDLTETLSSTTAAWRINKRDSAISLHWEPRDGLPAVPFTRKLLGRLLERLFAYCSELAPDGGILSITAGNDAGTRSAPATLCLNLTANAPLPTAPDPQVFSRSLDGAHKHQALWRAIEVLRRFGGDVALNDRGPREFEIELRLTEEPQPATTRRHRRMRNAPKPRPSGDR